MVSNRLEALADAICHYNKAHDPTSTAYQNRNPGKLRAISLKHTRDEHGFRVFHAYIDGYQALLYDLRLKASGASFTKLPPNATITDLMRAYGHTGTLVGAYVAGYIKKALIDDAISADTPLASFLASEPK